MLEILAMIKQSLECWKAHQRQTRHLIVDTWLLEKISEKEGKNRRAESTKLFTVKYCAKKVLLMSHVIRMCLVLKQQNAHNSCKN